jgi:hypothetical protein
MRTWARAVALCLGLCVVPLAEDETAEAAKRKAITGTLSKPGYTVIALGPGDQATVVRATRGRFKLRPPAGRVTLHLRAPNGKYAGPIVVRGAGAGKGGEKAKFARRKGKKKGNERVIVGVKAGARLGKVQVKLGKRFGLARAVAAQSLDARQTASAKKGVPIGAGSFGRVRVRKPKGGSGDRDLDGIPDVIDVDDDGDLVLDRVDLSTGARAAQDPTGGVAERFGMHTRLQLTLGQTANANAAPPGSPLTVQQIDTALSSMGNLLMDVLPGDSLPNSPELDCGGAIQQPPRPVGLVYCRPHSTGGIGSVFGAPFPDNFDPDGDGLGTLRPDGPPPPMGLAGMTLEHHATTADIGTGDMLMQRVTRGGEETAFLATLPYIFATVPALVSYQDTTMPAPAQVNYPFPSGPGTALPVSAPPGQDVVVKLTFWRPQRLPLAKEACLKDRPPCAWIDIGGLDYQAGPEYSPISCPQSTYLDHGPNLTATPVVPSRPGAIGFRDLAADQPASAANTFTYTLNFTQCLASQGYTFNPGEGHGFSFAAYSPDGVDNAQQYVGFERQP